MISLTKKENRSYRIQRRCYICKKTFALIITIKKYHKVRDNCDYTGKYRGAT